MSEQPALPWNGREPMSDILWEAFDSDHMLRVGAVTREGDSIVLWNGSQRIGTFAARVAAPSDGLRAWLRHKDWCNCKTDDPPDTERCKCGLRAALATTGQPKPEDWCAACGYAHDADYIICRATGQPAQPEDTRTADPGGLRGLREQWFEGVEPGPWHPAHRAGGPIVLDNANGDSLFVDATDAATLVNALEGHGASALTPEATAPRRVMTIAEWEALPYGKPEPDEGYG